tara:strand:+ start:2720 stop:3187 length:468 start_codon:yes stop_codon:yes gene_type:complete
MFCGTTCIIAFIFLFANVYTIFSCQNINKQNFYSVLNNNQKQKYINIISERRNIYFMGFILGILLAFILSFYAKQFLHYRFNKISLTCFVMSITFITNYLFYILYPKSNYMLLELDDKRQIQEWLKIYKKMQFKYHFGFILGIIAVGIFCSGYNK